MYGASNPPVDSAGTEPRHAVSFGARAESLSLFGGKTTAALISFVVNILLARVLGATEYGKYSFIIALITFLSLFFDFGYFASGARLLTVAESEEEKRGYVGAIFMIGGVLSALFIGLVLMASRVVDYIFPDKIGQILQVVALLTPATIAPLLIEQVLKAMRRVYLLAVWNIAIKVFFITTLALFGVLGKITPLTASISYMLAGMAGLVVVALGVRPKLTGIAPYLRYIAMEQRQFGRALYIGKTANLASHKANNLLLAYFAGTTAVGQYNLAVAFGSLVTIFSQSVAASGFRGFAKLCPISVQLHRWNLVGIVVSSAAALIGGHLVIWWYLGPSYSTVGLVLFPALIASAFRGAYQLYNSWLLANGFGAELKRFLFIIAGINLLANSVLIPIGGAFGAAVASIICMATYLVLAMRNYRQKLLVAS